MSDAKRRYDDNDVKKVCKEVERALEQMGEQGQVNVAIEGVCGAGKTTLSALLADRYECNLFHMDDFFLRPEQRTPARYAQAGGNVDYERFQEEIVEHLQDRGGLVYRPFDCGSMQLGEAREVPYRKLNIVEGAYCCHPYFGDIYQLRFFVDLSAVEQRERILARNGGVMYQRFRDEWIPMENRYFETYKIREKCMRIRMDLPPQALDRVYGRG